METSSASDSVEIHGDVTRQEYARFNWWHQAHTVTSKVALGIWVAVIPALVIAALLVPRAREKCLAIASIAALYWLFVWAVSRRAVGKTYGSNRALQTPHHYVFSASGVSAEGPSASGQNQWNIYWRAVETRDAFYLYLATNFAVILPKRCFTSEEQMQRFREIVRAGMGERAQGIRG